MTVGNCLFFLLKLRKTMSVLEGRGVLKHSKNMFEGWSHRGNIQYIQVTGRLIIDMKEKKVMIWSDSLVWKGCQVFAKQAKYLFAYTHLSKLTFSTQLLLQPSLWSLSFIKYSLLLWHYAKSFTCFLYFYLILTTT